MRKKAYNDLLLQRDSIAKQIRDVKTEEEKRVLYEEFKNLNASLKYIPVQIVPGTEKEKNLEEEEEGRERPEDKPPEWDYLKRNSASVAQRILTVQPRTT